MISQNQNKLIADLKDKFRNGQYVKAIQECEIACFNAPLNVELKKLCGKMLALTNDYIKSIQYFSEVYELDNYDPETLFNLGAGYRETLNYLEAVNWFSRYTIITPNDYSGWFSLGESQYMAGLYLDSVKSSDKTIALNPIFADAWSNRGDALHELKRYDEALANYDHAIQIKPDYAKAWSNKGNILRDIKRYDEALAQYSKAIELNPGYAKAWSNKGSIFHDLQRYNDALNHFDQAILLSPDYASAWSNKGATLSDLKRYDEGLLQYDQAIQLKPDFAEAWLNRGATLSNLKRYDEALASYNRAIQLEHDLDFLAGSALNCKMLTTNWINLDAEISSVITKLRNNKKVINPFTLLAAVDSPELHLQAAKIWTDHYCQTKTSLPSIPRYSHKKIRIGYFSADFKNHPVSFLTSELFELHDRNQFEIFGFSLQSANPDDETRKRLTQAFDKFVDVEDQSDLDIAKLARNLEIDIAIDLGGHTQDARPGIFSFRAAPIQVNYLGYPGSMGAEYIDYIIADKTLIPANQQSFYSEKIVYLPNCFQSNDTKKVISNRSFSRQELGLPNTGFIFCCFNNNNKINPTIFKSWMRILSNTTNSYLWLLANTTSTQYNLRGEAQKLGIDPSRIIFGGKLPLPKYLARYRSADLFLDTLPFNAGTTASDALWAGLPVLTQTGKSFSGRMAASLLSSIGLPELITQTTEEYESLAIELTTNHNMLGQIKKKLTNNRLTTPLFNTQLFTKHIEDAFSQMYERYKADLAPEHLYIKK